MNHIVVAIFNPLPTSAQLTSAYKIYSAILMDQNAKPTKGRRLRRHFFQLVRNIKDSILDSWFNLVCISGVAGAALFLYSIPYRSPLLVRIDSTDDGRLYNDAISYPYLTPIFSSLVAGLVCSLIPFGTILLAQIWVRSFADASVAIMGLKYSLVTGTLVQVILKKFVGGVRPHYLAVCQPMPLVGQGLGFGGNMYPAAEIFCTGDRDRVIYALQSFPSGHSEVAFAGLGYLAIYLYTHLRVGDPRVTDSLAFWRMLVVLMPILVATYISATLILAYHHYVNDCLFGAAIGTLTALLGYRMAFRSLICSETNCEPRVGKRVRREIEKRKLEVEQSAQVSGMDGFHEYDSRHVDLEMGNLTSRAGMVPDRGHR